MSSHALAPFLSTPTWRPAPARKRSGVLVVALHGLALLALLNSRQAPAVWVPPAPLEVQLLSEAPRPATPPAPRLAPAMQPLSPWLLPQPIPEVSVSAATPLSAVPATAAPHLPATTPAPTEARPSVAPQPKVVPASALRYRVEPAVEVPRLSRRAGESGRVGLRVLFDSQGSPREIQLSRSSGFARLDAQALEAMQRARIQPIVEDGRPIEVIAQAWLEYELD